MAKEEAQQLLLNIKETQDLNSNRKPIHGEWKWWLLVAICTFLNLAGQTMAILVGRLYFEKGGNSTWLSTLVQRAGFPILFLPMYLYNPSFSKKTPNGSTTSTPDQQKPPSFVTKCFIYISFGLSTAVIGMMNTYAISILPASTYSLLCASQLAFNAIFAYFINSEKLTHLIINSIVLVTISASLVAMDNESLKSKETSMAASSIIGSICTVAASAAYALVLSMTQYCFNKILKKGSFSVVWEMQIYPSAVSTCACLVGLFVSGDFSSLKGEMEGFQLGKVAYVIILGFTAVLWQVGTVAGLWLIFEVSALFSNVVGTLGMPLVPLLGVVLFHEKFGGIKAAAMILAIWGFMSYIYQQYLDDQESRRTKEDDDETTKSLFSSSAKSAV